MKLRNNGFLFAAAWLVAVNGCGGTTSTPETVTPPAPPVEADASLAQPNGPPGAMEMPEGISPENAPASSVKESAGGIEMPKDVAVPSVEDASQSVDVSGPDIQFASWTDIEKKATSTGKITVVDVWSLSCAPCLKEFPGLVRLHNEYPDQLACIGVDVDFDGRKSRPPETYQERVNDFLKTVEADFQNYICTTPSDDVFTTLEIESIPTVLVFDAEGKLTKKFVDAGETLGFTYEKDVRPYVQMLVK